MSGTALPREKKGAFWQNKKRNPVNLAAASNVRIHLSEKQ
jgi:hypothetical protein